MFMTVKNALKWLTPTQTDLMIEVTLFTVSNTKSYFLLPQLKKM